MGMAPPAKRRHFIIRRKGGGQQAFSKFEAGAAIGAVGLAIEKDHL